METPQSEPLSVGTNNSPTFLIVDEGELRERMGEAPNGANELLLFGNNNSQELPVLSSDKLLEQLSSDDGNPLLVGSNNSPTAIIIDDGKLREQLSKAPGDGSELFFVGTNSTITFRVVDDEKMLDQLSDTVTDGQEFLFVGNNNSSSDLSNASNDGSQLLFVGNNDDSSLAGGQSMAADGNEPQNDDTYNWEYSEEGDQLTSGGAGNPITGGGDPMNGGDPITGGGIPTTGDGSLTVDGGSPIASGGSINDPDFFRGLFGGGNAPQNNDTYQWQHDLGQTSETGGSPAFAGSGNPFEGGSSLGGGGSNPLEGGSPISGLDFGNSNNLNDANLPLYGSNNTVEVPSTI